METAIYSAGHEAPHGGSAPHSDRNQHGLYHRSFVASWLRKDKQKKALAKHYMSNEWNELLCIRTVVQGSSLYVHTYHIFLCMRVCISSIINVHAAVKDNTLLYVCSPSLCASAGLGKQLMSAGMDHLGISFHAGVSPQSKARKFSETH